MKNYSFLKSCILLVLVLAITSSKLNASEVVEVTALTKNIILVHFDDGTVDYSTNKLIVESLNIETATLVSNYTIKSVDDANYTLALEPNAISRKSKGTEFQSAYGNALAKPWASEHFIYISLPMELASGKTYTLTTGEIATNGNEWNLVFDEKTSRSEAIHVNTLGYGIDAPKYGYIYQWMGESGGLDLSEFADAGFAIYNTADLENPVKQGTIKFRKAADNEETGQQNDTPNRNFLGAEVYECDFTDVTSSGNYILVVDGIGCSYPFKIGEDPIWEAYYNTARSLYHQRSGIRLAPPYTASDYIRPVTQNPKVTSDDGVSYKGKQFYSDFSFMDWANRDNGSGTIAEINSAAEGKPLEVAGWYHDAGDWDAYAHHQKIPIQLMTTYEYVPERFGDNELNIPESGNGVPDLVDEASWLIKFNYRLRKELMERGYSDGGVGGARVCSDTYTSIDGNSETNKPSWKETRRMVVTQADAFMTYYYAGQAAQFAIILQNLGKDASKWPVEMLDAVEFADMSYDMVNWIDEAEAAFAWASAEDNQPHSGNNYDSPLAAYRAYAATNLYRLTGKKSYHQVAKEDLQEFASSSNLDDDEGWGVYSYVLANNYDVDIALQNQLKNAIINTAKSRLTDSADKRACRWGNLWMFPMVVGHATTPFTFNSVLAYGLTKQDIYEDVAQTTVDYFLGTNPNHSTNMSGVGPRGLHAVFHLDSRYIYNDWKTYPGQIPYGPHAYEEKGDNIVMREIDGMEIFGGTGSWHYAWGCFSKYPHPSTWPGHEMFDYNIQAPQSMEFTIHQNSVNAAISYGFVNGRKYNNSSSTKSVGEITLSTETLSFDYKKQTKSLTALVDTDDATFPQLIWASSNEAVAYVTNTGLVTGLSDGTTTITCSTQDGSVSASCMVTNEAIANVPVEAIVATPNAIVIDKGQTAKVSISVLPDSASVSTYTFVSADETIAEVIQGIAYGREAGTTEIIVISDADATISDTITITVNNPDRFVLADFDHVIPSTDASPDSSQMFAPNGGILNLQAANPLVNSNNSSSKVVQYNRPEGGWMLIGFTPPGNAEIKMCMYKELRFQYYGADLNRFWVRFTDENGVETAYWIDVVGANEWQTVSVQMPSQGKMVNIIIFVDPEESTASTSYFDNFVLIADENPNCEEIVEPFLVDFEDYNLDWSAGYGAYAWSSAEVGKVDNPKTEATNESGSALSWKKDGTAPWAGFGLVFPETKIPSGSTISFQTYSETAIDNVFIKAQYLDPAEEEAEVNIQDLNLTPGYWNTVVVPASDLSASITNMDRMVFQPEGGKSNAFTFYLDNIIIDPMMVYPDNINISGKNEIEKNKTLQLSASISPAEAANKSIIWKSSNENIATVSETGLIEALAEGETTITAIAAGNAKVIATKKITVTRKVGVNNFETNSFKVYPNPTKEFITVECNNEIEKVELYNLSGKLIQRFDGKLQNKISIQLNNIQAGSYLIQIHSSQNSLNSLLIVQ
ncbi:MAG: Ig-like domain-containing protein [Prolixibacteraceae bacterium]